MARKQGRYYRESVRSRYTGRNVVARSPQRAPVPQPVLDQNGGTDLRLMIVVTPDVLRSLDLLKHHLGDLSRSAAVRYAIAEAARKIGVDQST